MSRIDWLVCRITDSAALAAESAEVAAEDCLKVEAGPSLRLLDALSPAEREILAGLRFPKRRREWLLGRWTAKRLLKHARPEYADLALDRISVCNDPDGAPYLSITDKGRLPISLSISHRNDRAFCALLSPTPPRTAATPAASSGAMVGADLELVETRDRAFVNDYFTAGETERVWRCPEQTRDTLVTVLWSAKEAVLKVLRLGLTVDTRRVELRHIAGFEPSGGTAPVSPAPDRWFPIEVYCSLPNTPPLCAWWRPQADHVLTLAAFATPDDPPCPRAAPAGG